jgi:hypothetical protein
MNKKEVAALLGYLATIYRNAYKGDDLAYTTMAWADLLIDEQAEYMMAAAKQYIKTDQLGYAPGPGQLLPIAKELKRKADDVEKDKMRLPEPDPVPLTDDEIAARKPKWDEARKILQD